MAPAAPTTMTPASIARRAAAILARKTGAALLPLGLPLGLGGSAAWLRAAAEASGIPGKTVSAVLGRELAAAHGLARLAVGGGLAGKRICFTGDPYLGEAVCSFAGELGMAVAGVCLSCAGGKWAGMEQRFPGRLLRRDFRVREYSDAVRELFARGIALACINYVGAPQGGVLRATICSAHTDAHIDHLLAALKALL